MKKLDKLKEIVDEFINSCKIIDDTAHEINKHSEEFLKYLDMSCKLNFRCKEKFESISNANCALRDQYDIIWNTSSILLKNIIDQQDLLNKINNNNLIDEKNHKKLMFRISILREALEKVGSILKMIISRNNEIILIDYLLVLHNEFENEMLNRFFEFKTELSVVSTEILKISNKLLLDDVEGIDNLKNIVSIFNNDDKDLLSSLVETINSFINFEERINANIQSFFTKMTETSMNVKKIYKITGSVFDLLKKKEKLVKLNLEKVAEIAVVLSLEIKDYLKVQDLVEVFKNLEIKDVNNLSMLKMMEAYMNIAFDNIEKLVELNHYMVEIFDSNVINEEQSIELVKMNSHCVKNLKAESNRIYDFTHSERELVNKNLEFSKIISKSLEETLGSDSESPT